MRDAIRDIPFPQPGDFDFPCSTTFRQFFGAEDRRARRRRLPSLGVDDRAHLWREYIAEIEDKNFKLRVALDMAHLRLAQLTGRGTVQREAASRLSVSRDPAEAPAEFGGIEEPDRG